MASSTPRCTHCNIALPEGADRCPRCLRKSTVVDPADVARRAGEREGDGIPKHIGVRFGLAAGTLILGGLFVWALFGQEQWLKAHDLWLGAMVASMGLTTMPLRAGFARPESVMTPRQALRYYGLLMASVVGTSLALAGLMVLASRLVGDTIPAIFLGLLMLLLLLFSVPVAVGGLWRRDPLGKTLKAVAKSAGLAVAVVAMVAAIVGLRALKSGPPKPPLVIPENPKALLDPLDLEDVRVVSRTIRGADGLSTLHLQADGGDIKRTLAKLYVESLLSVDKVRKDPDASGQMTCWIPARLRTPANEAEARGEQATINQVVDSPKFLTAGGRKVRVSFEFGEIPAP